MFKQVQYYVNGQIGYTIYMPFKFEDIINDWGILQRKMIRNIPNGFTRDEWAYLILFLGKSDLIKPISISFGKPVTETGFSSNILVKPRGIISLWLPNNVSLLGPLMLIILSLSGNQILIKGGSRSKNLTGVFLDYILKNLPDGLLKNYLLNNVKLEFFEHSDDRNLKMASSAHVRIFFGSTEAGKEIDRLDHTLYSEGFYFIDRQSEAWIDFNTVDDELIDTLIKVFTVYGQAGCTSPQRVVLIDGNFELASVFREHLLARWNQIDNAIPPQYVASENIMAGQLFIAHGWNVKYVYCNKAVIPVGKNKLTGPDTLASLPITWGSLNETINQLPENIQTIGHSIAEKNYDYYLVNIASTSVKRFVPLSQMHHFGPIWDGFNFWNSLFEQIEINR